jgi:hypothetical protein
VCKLEGRNTVLLLLLLLLLMMMMRVMGLVGQVRRPRLGDQQQ